MTWFEWTEALSYVVTVIGLPLAILVFREDYMREWCQRSDFRVALPELLQGEDEDFREHIQKIADAEETHQRTTQSPWLASSATARQTESGQGVDLRLPPHPATERKQAGDRVPAPKAVVEIP